MTIIGTLFSNTFSSETAWSVKAKFYVELPLVEEGGGGGQHLYYWLSHMTKMATMPIFGKTF